MTTPRKDEAPYQALRPLMFSIAYRMTGSISDAEDIVQEAFLGLTRGLSEGTVVESPKATGRVINVFVLDIADGTVQAIRSVVNPDKLDHLGPVSDMGLRSREDL